MNITIEREREIKSQRARELAELRSKGVTNERKSKLEDCKFQHSASRRELNEIWRPVLTLGCSFLPHLPFLPSVVSKPLTTPEQAKMFLAAMRDKSREKEWEHKPPAHLSADGMDAWYMMQRKREQEMRLRRQEAEKILRGYRGPYFSDDASAAWSPRSHRKSRSSFGQTPSESLIDPSQIEKRRQSTMPRLEHNYDEDGSQRTYNDQPRKRFGPERTEFLNERQHYDGTQYERAEGNAFENGKSIFRDSQGRPIDEREMREPGATFDPSRFIDISASQGRLSEASGRRSLFSYGSAERDDIPGPGFQENENETDEHVSDVPETVWRDFISPGKDAFHRKVMYYMLTSTFSPNIILKISRAWCKVSSRGRKVPSLCLVRMPGFT